MPLVHSFELSTKKGKRAWVEPVVDQSQWPPMVSFTVKTGAGKAREGTVDRRGATCLCCNTPVPFDHIRNAGKAKMMGEQLMAIVAEGKNGRVYLPSSPEHTKVAHNVTISWKPDGEISHWPGRTNVVEYGMTTFGDLFTNRQLVALATFSDLVQEARTQVQQDGLAEGLATEQASVYADAVATYLGLAVSRLSDISNALCRWENTRTQVRNLFTRQAIPMLWDFAEPNIFAGAAGDYTVTLGSMINVLTKLPAYGHGICSQRDASSELSQSGVIIATDPPYYDNIGYADLSDFFYVWLRKTLTPIYPELLATLLVPKSQELVATPYRFQSNKTKAQEFFEKGIQQVFQRWRADANNNYPVTVYYAFKQAENGNEGTASTGWETMLEGLVQSGFQIVGTWPMRTELGNRMLAAGTNALASSVVLVCRQRPNDAPLATRRDFLNALRRELPAALQTLQQGNIAPVDLAQAAIGPGMAIFSRYSKVIESGGEAMRVRTALALINGALDEFLTEQEGDYDADTRWALAWFEQHGFDEGAYGDAETLCTAKNTSVRGMVEAGFLQAGGGKVRLLRRQELAPNWDPAKDSRLTVWEVTQQLIRTLESQGEVAAADLLARIGGLGETARELAYRLYSICERKGWAQEAIGYNALVVAWSEVGRMAGERSVAAPVQGELYGS